MALRLRIIAAAVALLALGGCSWSAPAETPASETSNGVDAATGRPVLLPGTVVATGEFSGDPRVTGSLAVVIGDTGDYELRLASFTAAEGIAPQLQVLADELPVDGGCPLPFIARAPLDWTLPDMRPGLTVTDSGPTTGAEGEVVLQGSDPLSYTVANGDSLAAVAARFGIELDELFYLNPTRSPNPEGSTAFTGETLNLSRANR